MRENFGHYLQHPGSRLSSLREPRKLLVCVVSIYGALTTAQQCSQYSVHSRHGMLIQILSGESVEEREVLKG